MLTFSMLVLAIFVESLLWIRKKHQKTIQLYIYVVAGSYLVGYLYVTFISRMLTDYIPPPNTAFMSSIWTFIESRLGVDSNGSAICNGLESGSGIGAILEGMALNVILYIPMGCLLSLIVQKPNVKVITCAGNMISLLTEILQLIAGLGWCDIDDVVMNTLGTWIGCWLSKKVFTSI